MIILTFDFILCVNKDNPFFEDAFFSIFSQDYQDGYGVIIVANNCTDDFFDKLKKMLPRKEKISVTLARTSMGQLAFNLNYAANLSTADYLVRMDADDISLPNRLSIMKKKIIEFNYPDVISGGVNYIDEKGCFIKSKSFDLSDIKLRNILAYKNIISHPASAIKRTTLIDIRGYAGGLNSEDYDLWLRLLRQGYSIKLFSDLVLLYRINSYQVKGSSIAYADDIGLKMREFFLSGNIRFFIGSVISMVKYVYLFWLIKFLK